jgi:hypothetical protein
MIEPIDYLIDLYFEHKIDMLSNMSMPSNANAIKYAEAYDDFDPNNDYNLETVNEESFNLTT